MYSYYETQYLGAAHGLTGILLQLLSVPHYLEHNPGAERDIRAAVNFIVSHQTYDGNFLCSMGEVWVIITPAECHHSEYLSSDQGSQAVAR